MRGYRELRDLAFKFILFSALSGMFCFPLYSEECEGSLRSLVNQDRFLRHELAQISTSELYMLFHGLALESKPSLNRKQFSRRFGIFVQVVSAFVPQMPPFLMKIPPDPVKADRLVLEEIHRRGLSENDFLNLENGSPLDLLNEVSGIHPSREIRRKTGKVLDVLEYQIFLGNYGLPPLNYEQQAIQLMNRVDSWVSQFRSGRLQEEWLPLIEQPILNERYFEWVLGDLKLVADRWGLSDRRQDDLKRLKDWLVSTWKEVNLARLEPQSNPLTEKVMQVPAYMY